MKCKLNHSQKLCDENECIECFNRSFASNPKSKFWSKDNILTPREVFKSSGKRFIFECHICCHTFDLILRDITRNNAWCPYCCKPAKKMCQFNSCKHCYNNSFASHYKSKYWSNKNIKTPREVFKSSGKKFWFKCINNHEFLQALNKITNSNRWCAKCCNSRNYSLKQIAWLEYEMNKDNIYIQHALNEGEYKYKRFSADGYCKETNTWYIFQGDFWHCNPELYSPHYINPLSKKRAINIWIYDMNRINYLKKYFNVKVMWENEWDNIAI